MERRTRAGECRYPRGTQHDFKGQNHEFQKWGGIAALICAASYLFGFALLLTLLAPSDYGTDTAQPEVIVGFIVRNIGLMTLWNMVIYVVNGLALAVLAVLLGAVFAPATPHLAQVIRTIGAIWATLGVGAGMVANVGNAAVVQ